MSNYTRQNDFSAKDALATGNPDKIISGADVDEELDAVVTAVATKQDAVSGATSGNVATLSSTGFVQDGGTALSVLARTDQNEIFTSRVDVEGNLRLGKDGSGTSLMLFYDDTNDNYRSLKWDDTDSEFQCEDAGGAIRTIVHSGNFTEYQTDDIGDIGGDQIGSASQTASNTYIASGLSIDLTLPKAGKIHASMVGESLDGGTSSGVQVQLRIDGTEVDAIARTTDGAAVLLLEGTSSLDAGTYTVDVRYRRKQDGETSGGLGRCILNATGVSVVT